MPGFNPFDVTTKRVLNKLGGDKKSYSMTYDGKLDDKLPITLVNGAYFVKVSDKVLTKEELLGASYEFSDETFVIAEQNIIDNSAMGVTTKFYGVIGGVFDDDIPMIVSCEACTINFNGNPIEVPSDGTYFLDALALGLHAHVYWLSKETIVPIDQKYLGGVCLPVVEIADISAITAEEGAELGKHIGIPVVIKVNIDNALNCCVFNYTYISAYSTHMYGTTIGNDAVLITSSDGVSWTKG